MDEDEASLGPSGGHEVVSRAIADIAATAVGLAAATHGGPVAGAFISAGLTPVFERIADYDHRAGRNAAAVAQRGAHLAGLTPTELAAWAEASPARLVLLARVVDAAWHFADDRKIEGLARVLAEATADDARLDLATLIVAALRELEPAHVQVLRAMTEHVNTSDAFEDKQVGESGEWATSHLAAHLPHLADGMHYVVATLDRVGCIELGGSRFGSASWWAVTPFGETCLDHLRTVHSSSVPRKPT